jgi:hypothetical protein
MTTDPQYRGTLAKGDTPGTVVGSITDSWGWVIELRGTLDPETRAYRLEGRLGPTPPALHIVALDGPRAEEPAG